MKSLRCLLIVPLALALAGIAQTRADSEPAPSTASNDTVSLEVLKVFYVKKHNANFRAYLVKWEDQEVIASDTLVETDYHVGDMAGIMVIRGKHPQGDSKPGLLSFLVLPPKAYEFWKKMKQ